MDKEELNNLEDKIKKEKKDLEERMQQIKEEEKKLKYLNGTKRIYGRKLSIPTNKETYKEAYYENTYKEENNISNKKLVPLLVLIVILSFISGFMGAIVVVKYSSNNNVTVSKGSTSNVKITETSSISDAVNKVYDAVVVVEGYKDNNLVSTGTGFVYKKESNKAYIMTNNHVIESAKTIKVLFNNGDEIETKIVGSDTYSDIAVLSITDSNKISVAQTGNTSKLSVGDTVFAVGSPEGSTYAGTVTKGVLSAKERLVEVALSNSNTSDYYMKVLQTDTAINPGNSGGPLCNINGEVIGITNMKLVDSSVEGMGFAIPIEDALTYAESIEKTGKVARPYIGISMLDLSDSYYLWQAGITLPGNIKEGVAIYSVENSSPAAKAGLQKGDIITEVAGTKVGAVSKFRYELYKHSPNETIEIKYYRNGKLETTKITLSQNNS